MENLHLPNVSSWILFFLRFVCLDKEPLIKLAMTRQENRHNRPGMDLVRDEVSYGVCIT